jgi:hypothetical protein
MTSRFLNPEKDFGTEVTEKFTEEISFSGRHSEQFGSAVFFLKSFLVFQPAHLRCGG